MSVFSCNMQKYKMSDVKGLEIEVERDSHNLKNKDINYDKKLFNYDIVKPKVNLYQDVKGRVSDLQSTGSRIQKNSVVCAGFIFTLPDNVEFNREREYFQICTDFLKDCFGEKNIMSAKVHKDESRPHLHVYLVPENIETCKLQARKSLDRNFLNKLHDKLPKQLQNNGFDVYRGDSKNKKYIKDIHEFKKAIKDIEELENKKFKLEVDCVNLEVDFKCKTKFIKSYKKALNIEPKKSLFSSDVKLSQNDYKKLVYLAKQGIASKNLNTGYEETIKLNKGVMDRISKKIKILENKENELNAQISDVNKLKKELESMKDQASSMLSSAEFEYEKQINLNELYNNLEDSYDELESLHFDKINAFESLLSSKDEQIKELQAEIENLKNPNRKLELDTIKPKKKSWDLDL